MKILQVFISCAKIVAVAIVCVVFFALAKYLLLKFRGHAPAVAVTAFVVSAVTVAFEQYIDFVNLVWIKFLSVCSQFSDGVTLVFLLFAIMLCLAIAARLDILSKNSFYAVKIRHRAKATRIDACNLSNSYLAITPVLLS